MESKNPVKRFVDEHTGWSMTIAVGLGIGLVALGCWAYAERCWGSASGECEALRKSPPWIPLAALLTAPATLLGWYWRTDHKKRDLADKQRELSQKEQDLEIAKSQEVTSRFTAALETMETNTVGGIYALQRIAKDSPRDHWPIMQILAAALRGQMWPTRESGETRPPNLTEVTWMQAALTAIGSRDRALDEKSHPLSLQNAFLSCLDFNKLNFEGVCFDHANLSGANLFGGKFTKATFAQCVAHDLVIPDSCNLSPAAMSALQKGGGRTPEQLSEEVERLAVSTRGKGDVS